MRRALLLEGTYGWLAVLFVFLTCSAVHGSSDCAPYPVGARIGNVSLSTGRVARGVAISVGNPSQSFAVLPLWPLNNSFLYGVDGHCLDGNAGGPDQWTSTGCTTFRGGAYDPIASKTRQPASAGQFPPDGTLDTLGNGHYPQTTQITDTLTLSNNLTFENYPMGVALNDWGAQGYLPMAAIGLGPASLLLDKMKSAGSIASRSWSFFWGQSNPGAPQLDGSLVFGGYDRAKVTGQKYTLPLTRSNPDCQSELVVTVTDFVLNFPNGTNASLFSGSKSNAISMCITPSLSALMRVPLQPYIDTMLVLTNTSSSSITRSVGMYFWNLQYKPGADPYRGDLTIKFQTGLSIRIPNNQIVVPHTAVNLTTGFIDVNPASPDITIDSLQDVEATKMAHLGWAFLSSAYVHVNQDTGQFSLWAANPTADQDLVAVDAAGNDVTSFCAAGSPTKTAVPSASISATSEASTPSQVSTGVIVGGALGGLSLLCVSVIVVVYLVRRDRRRRNAQTVSQSPRLRPSSTVKNTKYGGWGPRELPAYDDDLSRRSAVPLIELPADSCGKP